MSEREPMERLADLVDSDRALDDILRDTAELARSAIPGAEEVSITFLPGAHHGEAVAITGELAAKADERQYDIDHGPCLDASRGHEILIIDDMRAETRWPDYTPVAADVGVGSSLSVPLPVQEEVLGAINVYSTKTHAFGEASVEVAQRFASYVAVAIANAQLYKSASEAAGHMRRAMDSRAVIEQAKGIIMAQRRCGPAEAFDLLVAASQSQNVKLRVLAERVVEGVTK